MTRSLFQVLEPLSCAGPIELHLSNTESSVSPIRALLLVLVLVFLLLLLLLLLFLLVHVESPKTYFAIAKWRLIASQVLGRLCHPQPMILLLMQILNRATSNNASWNRATTALHLAA